MKAKCDYHGICKNKAYREVYYKGKCNDKKCMATSHWSYLCRKHFEQEKKEYFKKDKHWFYCSV